MRRLESIDAISKELAAFRQTLEGVFSSDTALVGVMRRKPSGGHCAAVADIISRRFDGQLVSANVEGVSHWFNRIPLSHSVVDVDLTGDQFGRAEVQIAPAGQLYSGTRVRCPEELDEDTRRRAVLLERRLDDALRRSRTGCMVA